jgi:TIR domain
VTDIFISWGSPDRAMVEPLRDRLRDLGLDVWEYSEDMGVGEQIQERVMQVIAQSRIAIFCLSDEAVARPWIIKEINSSAFAQTDGMIERLIPVQVGSLSHSNIPMEFKDRYILDLSDPERMSEEMERLLEDIYEILGKRAPLVMPAAIFAMTKSESMELFKEWAQDYAEWLKAENEKTATPTPGAGDEGSAASGVENSAGDEAAPPPPAAPPRAGSGRAGQRPQPKITTEQKEFWELCKRVGMDDPPELFDFFQERYGDTPEQMTPFDSKKKIIDVINEILREVNKVRLEQSLRPIFLHWIPDYLFEMTDDEAEVVRDQWRSTDSLLIVDSVSTFYPPIKSKLLNVPPQRTALLWLPPYTRHTAGLEQSLRSSARAIPSLGDEFRDWGKHPKRSVSFDTSTSLALQVWLRRALFQVSDQASPLSENLESVSSEISPPSNIGAGIFGRGGGR